MPNSKFIRLIMNDGSLHFGEMPENCSFERLREHAAFLAGAVETGFLTDSVTEVWLDFNFDEQKFTLNNQFGHYWFFVSDPTCPEETLRQVLDHFKPLLEG